MEKPQRILRSCELIFGGFCANALGGTLASTVAGAVEFEMRRMILTHSKEEQELVNRNEVPGNRLWQTYAR